MNKTLNKKYYTSHCITYRELFSLHQCFLIGSVSSIRIIKNYVAAVTKIISQWVFKGVLGKFMYHLRCIYKRRTILKNCCQIRLC